MSDTIDKYIKLLENYNCTRLHPSIFYMTADYFNEIIVELNGEPIAINSPSPDEEGSKIDLILLYISLLIIRKFQNYEDNKNE